MIQAMYSGVSGLRVHKTQMDVIANNIANLNTVGFKASRINFKEMFSQTLKGATAPVSGGLGGTNPSQIGLGASIGSIDVSQNQGSMQPTGKLTDLAVEGNGFFILGDGQGMFYTRDGSFSIDAEGALVSTSSGMQVLGWPADTITGAVDTSIPVTASSAIRLPIGQLARQTSYISYGGNLDEETPVGGTRDASVMIYDSLGERHLVKITFTKTAVPLQWDWQATSPDADPAIPVGSGTIIFDALGHCTTPTGNINLTFATPNGAVQPVSAALSFESLTQLAGTTTVSATSQNGLPMGMLESFTISKDGMVMGIFTNGTSQPLARIALATFSNPTGLSKTGNNLLVESSNSGLPQVGEPSVGSVGRTIAGFLESSNVDLPTEFSNMIVAQRGFQANSRIITTSDEILQELVQMKR